MGEQLVVEAPGRRQPLVTLPRGKLKNADGDLLPPIVDIDLDFGKRPAGCCICDIPIRPETTRIVIRVWLHVPVPLPNGRSRRTEKYYAHPGCLTDRVRPEVIRTRVDCYDCGAIPEQVKDSLHHTVHHNHRCFTVSKFAAAPLCENCARKPRWKQCDACQVYFPHWMVSQSGASQDSVPAMHVDQYWDLTITDHDNLCEYCAQRLGIPTVAEAADAKAAFEKLRREIAERGIFGAGDDDD